MPPARGSTKKTEEVGMVSAISANLLHLTDKVDDLRGYVKEEVTNIKNDMKEGMSSVSSNMKEDLEELKSDVKEIKSGNNTQDMQIAVLQDRVGLFMKILSAGGVLIAGMILERVATHIM